MKRLRVFFNPEQYHGWREKRNFFEGWYYKVVDFSEKNVFAIIPGIAMDEDGTRHAFIQILDGKKNKALYKEFDFSCFLSDSRKFEIRIKNNFFSERTLKLDFPEISGELNFSGNIEWPKHWYSPGIMGPYSFVPFMECYHGMVSMDHSIHGQLEFQGKSITFDKGRGYIEKDWGHSFPSAYIWMQTNHFSKPGISMFASVAKIPWLRKSFTGFIAAIWLHDRLIKFTTYNRTILKKCCVNSNKVELIMENKNYRIEIEVKRDSGTSLAAPIQGFMDGRIDETMMSEMDVRLIEIKSRKTIFYDRGRNGGLDVAGNIEEIVT